MKMLCDVLHEASHFMQRDFGEIVQLQNSKRGTQDFTNKCYERIKSKLIKSFTEKRPGYGIITPNEAIPTNQYYAIIEPIVGINNFKHSIPFCAIAIGLFKQDSEEAGAVAIHNPILRETFYAAQGLGAWFENYNETIIPKSRMRVSSQNSFSDAFISSSVSGSINLGCDLLEIAYLAAARLDIVIKKNDNLINRAAYLLIKEAGGHIHIKDGYFLASNEVLHKQAVETLL
jgi:myo-inositol-1(or 4)-monophosphatase